MAELDRAQISARIKQARDEAGLTQPELADLLQSHWRTVQEWENVKNSNVPWDRLDEIAKATDRSRDWLLHGDRPASEPAAVDGISELLALAEANQALLRTVLQRLDALEGELQAEPAHPRDVPEPA